MIVVDTAVIAYLYLAGARSAQAERALVKDPQWSAPLLWRSELRNILAHYMRGGELGLEQAQQIMDAAIELMHRHEYKVSSIRVLNLVAASVCSAYACAFVGLAQDLGIPLVTVDADILVQFPQTAVSLDVFVGAEPGHDLPGQRPDTPHAARLASSDEIQT